VLLLQDRRQVAPGLQKELARWLAISFCLETLDVFRKICANAVWEFQKAVQ
jgi:hypothetical protein